MKTSLSSLAEKLNTWVDDGRVNLRETSAEIVLNRLSPADAREAVALNKAVGWQVVVANGANMATPESEIADDLGPYRIVLTKPDGISGHDRLITLAGLRDRLRRDLDCSVLHVISCSKRFDTRSLRICPFDDLDSFAGGPAPGSPRKVVREMGDTRLTPADIGPWLLADADAPPPSDPAFEVWREVATPRLLRCLANEVTTDALVMRGPPTVTLEMGPTDAPSQLDVQGFLGLQKAAGWVYETDRDLETRHGLFTAEIARAAVAEGNAASAFKRLALPALASAKIAYGLVLSGVNRDTLKALADLRKAVTDETGKLADTVRALAGTVATTVFAGLGLVLARLKADLPPVAMGALAFVLLFYVGSVIWSGWSFVRIQRNIRSQWKARLYSFLESDEYEEMVGKPVAQAEQGFLVAARAGAAITVLICGVLIGLAVFEEIAQQKGATAPTPSVPSQPTKTNSAPATASPTHPGAPQQNATTLSPKKDGQSNGAVKPLTIAPSSKRPSR
jgi:hypothetical protein